MTTTLFSTHHGGFDITLTLQDNDRFTVQYGSAIYTELTREEAAKELGDCIIHAGITQFGRMEN
jgi:hypothetical protein